MDKNLTSGKFILGILDKGTPLWSILIAIFAILIIIIAIVLIIWIYRGIKKYSEEIGGS